MQCTRALERRRTTHKPWQEAEGFRKICNHRGVGWVGGVGVGWGGGGGGYGGRVEGGACVCVRGVGGGVNPFPVKAFYTLKKQLYLVDPMGILFPWREIRVAFFFRKEQPAATESRRYPTLTDY